MTVSLLSPAPHSDSNRILFANSRLVEMTGIPRSQLVGSGCSSFYSSLEERDCLTSQIDISFQQRHNRYKFALPQEGGGRLPFIIGCWLETVCDYVFYFFLLIGMTIGQWRSSGSRAYLGSRAFARGRTSVPEIPGASAKAGASMRQYAPAQS
jgi:PAS domain-containing protein